MSASRLAVAILTGGEASRLGGRDKGLEPLGGRPLIEWALQFCRSRFGDPEWGEVEPEILIVANRHFDEYARYGRVIADAEPGFRGPLAGVASALAACSAPYLSTIPVDCPSPPADLVPRLLAAIAATNAPAAVAHDGERRQPLFALYRRELSASAAQAVSVGQGVWQWQTTIAAREVDFADRRQQFHNLNTPADFAAYADVLRSRD